jgi:hypothetical protein
MFTRRPGMLRKSLGPRQVKADNKYLFELDPHKLKFTETGQRSEHVGEVDTSKPILTTKIGEDHHVVDGHHRALKARQENRPVRSVVMPSADYHAFKESGMHQGDMHWAFVRLLMHRKDPDRHSHPLEKSYDDTYDQKQRDLRASKKAHQPEHALDKVHTKFNGEWNRPISYSGAKEVTVHRGVPGHVDSPNISPGDWVSLSKKWASKHGGEGNKVTSHKVPASDVYWAGTDENEWFYAPHD